MAAGICECPINPVKLNAFFVHSACRNVCRAPSAMPSFNACRYVAPSVCFSLRAITVVFRFLARQRFLSVRNVVFRPPAALRDLLCRLDTSIDNVSLIHGMRIQCRMLKLCNHISRQFPPHSHVPEWD